jgi:hypothetical protein
MLIDDNDDGSADNNAQDTFKDSDFSSPDDDLEESEDDDGEGEDGDDDPADSDDDDADSDDDDGDDADDDADDDDEDGDDATADVTYEGKAYTIPKALEKAIMQEADYTQGKQQLADQAKVFEEQVGAAEASLKLQTEQFEQAAQIRAIDIQLAQYDEVDWPALMAQDPATFQQLDFEKRTLQEQRNKANLDLAYKSEEVSKSQHAIRVKAGEKTRSELSAKYADWSPALEEEMAQFAIGLGVPERQLRTTTNKATLDLLYMAHKWQQSETARIAAASKTPKGKKKPAKPARRIPKGGKQGGPTNPDDLSIEKWVARRNKQIAKREAANA